MTSTQTLKNVAKNVKLQSKKREEFIVTKYQWPQQTVELAPQKSNQPTVV